MDRRMALRKYSMDGSPRRIAELIFRKFNAERGHP